MRFHINNTFKIPMPSLAMHRDILSAAFLLWAVLAAWAQNEAIVYFTVPEGQAVQLRTGRDEIQWRVGESLFEEGPCIEGESFPILIGTPSQVKALSRRRGSGVRSLGTVGGYMYVCPDQCASSSTAARQYTAESINITMPSPDPFRSLGDKLAQASTNDIGTAYAFVSGPEFEYTVNGDRASAYTQPVSSNPRGPASGTERIVRGGTWNSPAENLRCAWRGPLNPTTSNATVGLRCVRNR